MAYVANCCELSVDMFQYISDRTGAATCAPTIK